MRGPKEQDLAAGGRDSRIVRLPDGKLVTVSVAVRVLRPSIQTWAYMQFKTNNRTVTKYIGKATAPSRLTSLRIGWKKLREKRIVEKLGGTWVKTH